MKKKPNTRTHVIGDAVRKDEHLLRLSKILGFSDGADGGGAGEADTGKYLRVLLTERPREVTLDDHVVGSAGVGEQVVRFQVDRPDNVADW